MLFISSTHTRMIYALQQIDISNVHCYYVTFEGFSSPSNGRKTRTNLCMKRNKCCISSISFSFLFTQGESSFRRYRGAADAARPIAITASNGDATFPPGIWFAVGVNLVTGGEMICDILFVLHNFSAYHTFHHMWGLLWDGKVKRKKERKLLPSFIIIISLQ